MKQSAADLVIVFRQQIAHILLIVIHVSSLPLAVSLLIVASQLLNPLHLGPHCRHRLVVNGNRVAWQRRAVAMATRTRAVWRSASPLATPMLSSESNARDQLPLISLKINKLISQLTKY